MPESDSIRHRMPRPSHAARPKKRRGIILQPELVVKGLRGKADAQETAYASFHRTEVVLPELSTVGLFIRAAFFC
jgi:hypothetical protein